MRKIQAVLLTKLLIGVMLGFHSLISLKPLNLLYLKAKKSLKPLPIVFRENFVIKPMNQCN